MNAYGIASRRARKREPRLKEATNPHPVLQDKMENSKEKAGKTKGIMTAQRNAIGIVVAVCSHQIMASSSSSSSQLCTSATARS
jgi:hypothetical protein